MTKENKMIQYLMNQITDKKKQVLWLQNGNGNGNFTEIHIANYKEEIRILCDILESVGK